jgi:NitT/TauT family transport system permease protein
MSERLWTIVLGPLLVVTIVFLLLKLFPHAPAEGIAITPGTVALATIATIARLTVAYVLAALAAVPLAVLVSGNALAETILLPVFDVFESVPVLALFPIIILLFIRVNSLNGAAIFILFLTMLWNIVFTVVGGIKIIPKDIIAAARVFGIRGLALFDTVTLPAIVPQLVTGSILAVAQGWNIIIVAEVLHTYIPGGTSAQDLFGVGSILVNAAAQGQRDVFFEAVFAMVIVIALFNFLVWQRLLHFSQRFRFD